MDNNEAATLQQQSQSIQIQEEEIASACQQSGLNSSQTIAIIKNRRRCLNRIQGPPETGKTRTIMAIIDAYKAEREMRPMGAMAAGNLPVDAMTKHARRKGIPVIRLGNRKAEKIDPEAHDILVEQLAYEKHSAHNANKKTKGLCPRIPP